MKYIAHRINLSKDLSLLNPSFGVELDLRDGEDELILHHDPFQKGEYFEEYLRHYNHSTIILNIKSEGIEYKVLDLLNKYKIEDFFFLDCSYPMVNKLIKNQCNKIALRFSEYERMENIEKLASKVQWVWVDSFEDLHFTKLDLDNFQKLGLKSCLVSPDLLQREEDISRYAKHIIDNELIFDAICCKSQNISVWKALLEYKHEG